MKILQTLIVAAVCIGFSACQLTDEVEEIFPGFVVEEGKLYEVSGKAPYSGQVTDYFDDGSLKQYRTYDNGELIHVIHYFRNGNKRSEVQYTVQGMIMTSWYESGQIEEEFTPGLIRQWHENGQMKSRVALDDFREYHGDMKMWDKNGELIAHEVYENGDLIESVVANN
jgi:antitoxin component YwqK of YwqJK toxin-antitoxin module